MKITFVARRSNLSGGSRVIAIYADFLARRGHDVCVVSQPHPKHTLREQTGSLLRTGRLPRRPAAAHHFLRPGINYRAIDAVRPIVDADLPDADVVIATWWETAYWVAALAPEKGRKFYFVQHHEVHGHLSWQISRGSYYLPLKKIAVSQWLVDIMAREYGDHDVALVPNGVDTDQFDAPERGRQPVPTVGLMYATKPFKGTDVSLEAVRQVAGRLGEVQLVAFGMAEPDPQLPLPPRSRFTLKPAQAAIRDIYAACDVWLFGSRAEGFGLPILEAMACRTPVVATRAGAAPDLIRDGINGHVVGIDDAEAMAGRITDVLALAPADWRAMSDAARATAQANTWDSVAGQFEHALLAGTPAPAGRS